MPSAMLLFVVQPESNSEIKEQMPIKQFAAGTLLDEKYVVIECAGAGGMGSVYKASQVGLDRIVAIKVLEATTSAQAQSLKRFEREAQILSQLQHESIAQFYHFGVLPQGTPYIAMEFAEGKTLRSLFSNAEFLLPEEILTLAIQICEALSYAHSKGILHRDLKPDNIMISDGRIKLIDFGLAKAFEDHGIRGPTLTESGLLVGSVHYISPEICLGKKPDNRSDVYSLGCIIYEALSGHPPFDAETPVGTIYQHTKDCPPRLVNSNPNKVPAELERIVFKCLAKEPAERYSSVDALRVDLEKIVEGRLGDVTAAVPATLSWQEASSVKRNLRPKVLVLLLISCVLCFGALPVSHLLPRHRDNLSEQEQIGVPTMKPSSHKIGLGPRYWIKQTGIAQDEWQKTRDANRREELRLKVLNCNKKSIELLEKIPEKSPDDWYNLGNAYGICTNFENEQKIRTFFQVESSKAYENGGFLASAGKTAVDYSMWLMQLVPRDIEEADSQVQRAIKHFKELGTYGKDFHSIRAMNGRAATLLCKKKFAESVQLLVESIDCFEHCAKADGMNDSNSGLFSMIDQNRVGTRKYFNKDIVRSNLGAGVYDRRALGNQIQVWILVMNDSCPEKLWSKFLTPLLRMFKVYVEVPYAKEDPVAARDNLEQMKKFLKPCLKRLAKQKRISKDDKALAEEIQILLQEVEKKLQKK